MRRHRRSGAALALATALAVALATLVAPPAGAEEVPSRHSAIERALLDLLATSPTVPDADDPTAVRGSFPIAGTVGRAATVRPLPDGLCDRLDGLPPWLCSGDLIDPSTGTGPFDPAGGTTSRSYGDTLVIELPTPDGATSATFEVGCKVTAANKAGRGTSWSGTCGFTVKFGRASATTHSVVDLTAIDPGAAESPWVGPAIELFLRILERFGPGDDPVEPGGGPSGGGGTPVPGCRVVVQCG